MGMAIALRRFTVDEYRRMAEAGILDEDDRVELLDGQIVEMTPIGPPHRSCVNRLTHLFAPVNASDRATLSIQNGIVPRSADSGSAAGHQTPLLHSFGCSSALCTAARASSA